ncbi:MAG: 3-dehydroquinate synthase [Chlamydiia bacterium]|nr:3-dehydroquinate synthase [Chlamydiia bacterium]
MKKIVIQPVLSQPMVPLYFGDNLLEGALLRDLCQELQGQVVIVADHAVNDPYGMVLAQRLHAELFTMPSGEQMKTRQTQEALENALFKMGCGRDTILIALGGGSTTDLVGFVASIYLRGVSLILIPTTLLGMVDASIGGKTAIDTPFGKNLLGTIYHPKAIIADPQLLKTLPKTEWLNGLAEVLKIGLIYDSSIWPLAQQGGGDDTLIFKAIQGKIAIIEQDPVEKGVRRILNFGHTIGHALETMARYAMPHGLAVAIGCVAEAHLSMQLGYLPKEEFEQILGAFAPFSLRLPPHYTRHNLFKTMLYDKKSVAGKVRCVLIDRIGHALPFEGQYCRVITEKEWEPTCAWMEKTCG